MIRRLLAAWWKDVSLLELAVLAAIAFILAVVALDWILP